MMLMMMMKISKMVDTATYYINLPTPFINFFKMTPDTQEPKSGPGPALPLY